jgi:hypothetical protein
METHSRLPEGREPTDDTDDADFARTRVVAELPGSPDDVRDRQEQAEEKEERRYNRNMSGWRRTVRVRQARNHHDDTQGEANAERSEDVPAHVAEEQPVSEVQRHDVGLAQSALSFRF